MIQRGHELPVVHQARLLDLSRAGVYYRPVPISAADLQLMRRIDELHLELPFAGARMLRDLLNQEGHRVGRKHVRTLMRRMGISLTASDSPPDCTQRVPRARPSGLPRSRRTPLTIMDTGSGLQDQPSSDLKTAVRSQWKVRA